MLFLFETSAGFALFKLAKKLSKVNDLSSAFDDLSQT